MIPTGFRLASNVVAPSGLPVSDIIVKSLRNDSQLIKRSFAHLPDVHEVVGRREVVVKSTNYFARFLLGTVFMSGVYINVRLGVKP